MQATAHLRYARISPRKVSIVGELIRGKDVKYARAVLSHTPKAAAQLILKTLNSACANAEDKYEDIDTDRLFVSEVLVGAGPTLKRIMPRARGRAFRILKRTSHITVTVAERE
ncbi:MAG: 50S ribosomal protein L22 [Oscillospiraceae bacterium]|nr:50S ribosomal protein L22 [Oscillospiraceae bacterium]